MNATEKVRELLSTRDTSEKAKRMFFEADMEARLNSDIKVTVYINTETGKIHLDEEIDDSNEYPLIAFSHGREEWKNWNKFMRVEMLRKELWKLGTEEMEKLDKFREDFWNDYKGNDFDDRLWNAILANPDFAYGLEMVNKAIVSDFYYDKECGYYNDLLVKIKNKLN